MTDTVQHPGVVLSGKTRIPVRNLWVLMLYASRLYQTQEGLRSSDIEDNPDELINLVAEVLVTAVERRLNRSLGRDYQERHAVLSRVRGRIDTLTTESRALLAQGRIACRFDELTVDNLRNRLVVTALDAAARNVQMIELVRRAQALIATLAQYGVSRRPLGRRAVATVTVGRNDQEDAEAVDAAKLMLEMAIATESAGSRTVRDPDRDAATVRRLYEQAVRGFYQAVLPPEWRVANGETHRRWPISEATPGLPGILPVMRTDIELETMGRRIIVETKFANALKPGQYGDLRLARNHLFQLYAYVQSQHELDELAASSEGVLLYPTVGQHIDESATIQGHRYRFLTVDLTGSTRDIRETLLSVPRNAH
ncbi:5-methylcytosine-specific restriction endonuclease system specificity protein McrC [Gordonia paraffinivorans]|uniref:5-methylcytosine-specific restriction endonuclease system specificity protein McrC n=1 Tax=Gordonia paraffinivorans TaxID=175628 RepID=UPI003FCD192E